MSEQGKRHDGGGGRRASGAASGVTNQFIRKRRSRAFVEYPHGHDSALLASISDLSFCTLDIRESFDGLAPSQQLRLYYVTMAAREIQKISFLQSSAESPMILLLFQELFYSPEEDLSPGELILELQQACFANGLGDAVPKFLKYVALFYHNHGNYDPFTGTKIIPQIKSFEFENIVRCSRAFAQRRGLRLKRAMDACLEAIFRPALTTAHTTVNTANEPTIVAINEQLSHPFYGQDVSYMDIVRVDRELDKHGILKINTRIIKEVDPKAVQRATFRVVQASISPKSNDGSTLSPSRVKNLHLGHFGVSDEPSQEISMPTQDHIQVWQHDFDYFLSSAARYLRQAADVVLAISKRSVHPDRFRLLVDKTLELWSNPSTATWNGMEQYWKTTGDDIDVDFLFSYSLLPTHRDPTGSRATQEGVCTITNQFYEHLVNRLLQTKDIVENVVLPVLPFNQQMTSVRASLSKIRFACVDLVFSSACGGILPVISRHHVDTSIFEDEKAVLFIANSAEHYTHGHVTAEKRFLFDGLFSVDDARVVESEWGRVAFLRFVLEDVLAPCTTASLPEDGENGSIGLLPAELYAHANDEGNNELIVEAGSDSEDEQDKFPLLSAVDRRRLWCESSFAQHLPRVNDGTSESHFPTRLMSILEECRVVMSGLLLALDDAVRQEIFQDCVNTQDETSWNGPVAGVEAERDEDPHLQNTAKVYFLLLVRDALLALAFFSAQQFRWEDDRMLARHMVLQMLLAGETDESFNPEVDATYPVVQVLPTVEHKRRELMDIALGVDEEHVVGLQVIVPIGVNHDGEVRSWCGRLKVLVRSWLQQLHWVLMTRDGEGGQLLYQRFALVNDASLRYRRFILSSLGDDDVKRQEDEISSGGRRGSSAVLDMKNDSKQGVSEPALPPQSMNARQLLQSSLNTSCFGTDTIWIAPFIRLIGNPSSNSASKATKHTHMSESSSPSKSVSDTKRQFDHFEQSDDVRKPRGQDDANDDKSSREDNREESNYHAPRVELRSFPADLCYAIEAAVLNVGIIDDEEATRGFGVNRGDHQVEHGGWQEVDEDLTGRSRFECKCNRNHEDVDSV